jgi:AraC family transcriptional regulator
MKSVIAQRPQDLPKYLPGSSHLGPSSDGLGWQGFGTIIYHGDRGERPELITARHTLGLWQGDIHRGERENGRGGFVRFERFPGTVTLIPPGIIRDHSALNRHQVILCLMESSFVNRISEESDQPIVGELSTRFNVEDFAIAQLITLLHTEAIQRGQFGRLYAEHLAHAITIRLFALTSSQKLKPMPKPSALPRHLLQRVIERMHDLNSDLDLHSLAAETSYSRSHFLRMFRAATGYTPHRYLLHIRLKRAQELMNEKYASLIDIAALCGFSSHAHMTRMFRQFLGVSPSEYRRNL